MNERRVTQSRQDAKELAKELKLGCSPRKLAKPVENPSLPVAIIPPRVRVGTAEERSSNAASDAVVNANTVFIDDVAARVGRHG